jgi:hypothetical protein
LKLRLAKATYIYRDPRDVAVSLFEHGARLRRDGMASRTGFDQLDTLESAIRFTAGLLPIWRAWTALPGVLAIRFEDYTTEMMVEAARLNGYLGLGRPTPVLRQVADGVDPKLASAARPSRSIHFHSGERGRWQTTMSSEHKELCGELLGPYLESMGYQA